MTTTTALRIETTKDYGNFRIMTGNRLVDRNHVNRLKKEMERDSSLLQYSPILVNENMFVIDGQHRLQAAKELNLPVHYIVGEGMTVSVARHLNATQRQWTLLDYAKSYADAGVESYKQFLEANNKFKKLSPSIIRLYLIGKDSYNPSEDFKLGQFMVKDFDEAIKNLERLDAVRNKARIQVSVPLAKSFLTLFLEDNDFDYEKLMQKLEDEHAQELLVPHSTIRNCLRSIEDAYNFRNKYRTRLY